MHISYHIKENNSGNVCQWSIHLPVQRNQLQLAVYNAVSFMHTLIDNQVNQYILTH